MHTFDSLRTITPELTIAVRMLLAALLGAVIGLEREYSSRSAGLRTHMLTSLAAAVFTIITFELFHETQSREKGGSADPIRVIEAVTAGVAFLAAGAIIQSRGAVHGLTTGAGLWLSGAIGVASGGGYYSIAVMATVLAILILFVVARLARQLDTQKNPTVVEKPEG